MTDSQTSTAITPPWSLPAALEHAFDLFACFDEEGRMVWANARCRQLTGWIPANGEAGRAERIPAPLAEAVCGVLASNAPRRLEHPADCPEPSLGPFACQLLPMAEGGRSGVLFLARDVSRRLEAERRLQEREYAYRMLAENSPDIIIRYGMDGRANYCNREINEQVAVSAATVVGHKPSEAAPPGMLGVEAYERQLAATLATGRPGAVELQVPTPNGETHVHGIAFSADRDADGRICGAIAVGRDITEQAEMRKALLEKERQFRSLAENAGDNIIRWGPGGEIIYLNPAMERQFGMAAEDVLGRTSHSLWPDGRYAFIEQAVERVLAGGPAEMVEVHVQVAPADYIVHQVRVVPERNAEGRLCSALGFGRDVTESVRHRHTIEALVRTDPLTGLGNRQALRESAARMLAAAARHGRRLGVMLLDLDRFKHVNDDLGHSAGDELLEHISRRLQACVRAEDLIVRLGGDEFVLLLDEGREASSLRAVADKLHRAIGCSIVVGGHEMSPSASIGVAVAPDDGEDFEQLLSHADAAMYHAKRNGRSRTEFYCASIGEAVRERADLEKAMREARFGNGLEAHCQPVVDLRRGGLAVGAEFLLRWRHPQAGLLGPDRFIPLAEETGMIVPMGRWMLRTAAAAAARWNRGRSRPFYFSVNVSARQFALDDVFEAVSDALLAAGAEPHWLTVEITESLLAEDGDRVRETLAALRAQGIRIAIDDFGTGYSALSYLTRFPVDVLKIDRSFVRGIAPESGGRTEDRRAAELAKAFIAMARALELQVVAEGVESDAEARFLVMHGCRYAQGYRFGRPLPLHAFDRQQGLGAHGAP